MPVRPHQTLLRRPLIVDTKKILDAVRMRSLGFEYVGEVSTVCGSRWVSNAADTPTRYRGRY